MSHIHHTGFHHSYKTHESYTECSRGLLLPVDSKVEVASSRTGQKVFENSTGYWIALTYGGQMTRATKNMAVHQCLAGAMSKGSSKAIQIVEPFSQESKLFHSPTFWTKLEQNDLHNAARFSNYYDLGHYNRKSAEKGCARLVKWEEFIQEAPRETVVVVSTLQGCSGKEHSRGATCPSSDTCELSSKYASLLAGLKRYGFSIIRTVCLVCSYIKRPLTVDELHREIYGNRSESELTVVFGAQRNYDTVHTWVTLPKHCSYVEANTADLGLVASMLIMNHTRSYTTTSLRSKNVIAVMFRIERLFEGRSPESLIPCLNDTIKLHAALKQQPLLGNSSTFVTLDIGRFGSEIMQRNKLSRKTGVSHEAVKLSIQDTLSYLYKGQWSLEEWEESFVTATGGITERGYIAMLQQSIAAHSDCLILIGGGSYQEVTAHQYISYHGKTEVCLHTVCMKDRWETW